MTNTQAHLAYRLSVQEVLVKFYGQTTFEAQRMVRERWEGLKRAGLSDDNVLLHDEPLNTAADMLRTLVIDLDCADGAVYSQILDDCARVASRSEMKPKDGQRRDSSRPVRMKESIFEPKSNRRAGAA